MSKSARTKGEILRVERHAPRALILFSNTLLLEIVYLVQFYSILYYMYVFILQRKSRCRDVSLEAHASTGSMNVSWSTFGPFRIWAFLRIVLRL